MTDAPERLGNGAWIEVRRTSDTTVDMGRRYWVEIDGERQGFLVPGGSRSVPVAPGRHRLRVTIDWVGSRVLDVHVARGGTATFVCSPRARSGFALADLLMSTLGRWPRIDLRQIDD